MISHKKMALSLLLALALLARSASVVGAEALNEKLPPLPEWPIIGPVLRMLGITAPEPEPEAMPTPDPGLPEYRITSFEDMESLDQIALNERVRIVVTDGDLNRMVLELLQNADLVEDARLDLDFDPGLVTADLQASASLLERLDLQFDIPRALRGRSIDATATMGVEATGCSINVSFDKLRVNNWRLGLRPLATRMVNERIPDFWASEICVEAVFLADGEAAVEGYRRE